VRTEYPEIVFPPPRRSSSKLPLAVFAVFILLASARGIASAYIDYLWWGELGQTETWWRIWAYSALPLAGATAVAFAVLWTAQAAGLRRAGERLSGRGLYARIAGLVLAVASFLIAASAVDTWTVVRFFGSREAAGAWQDPVFGKPLAFYLFDLPFWQQVRSYVLSLALLALLVHWLASRIWQLIRTIQTSAGQIEIDPGVLTEGLSLESRFLRVGVAILLAAVAWGVYLGRYELLTGEHGFMTGLDYVDEHIGLPLRWLLIAALALGAAGILAGRVVALALPAAAWALLTVVPGAVNALYVRPNEITLQRPYVERHIAATRSAFGLSERVKEAEYPARMETRIDVARHKPLFDNVRLWDWRAFHDTTTQIQALRPYYVFNDSDVDRYTIDGRVQQVLLSPRELDIRQLADARTRWINPHFIYTHGYGLVMAEANRITEDGLPYMLIQDAPPEVKDKNLKLTRPEIYFGEVTHEPVFVRTAQKEFSYPSGNDSIFTSYDGKGGFPAASLIVRVAAALREADPNILLTGFLTGESRMMIRRRVLNRLEELAGFLQWDADPYLVLTSEGRLVWTVDGYTTSAAHPYSAYLRLDRTGRVNYMRNSVKATVDAYDGNVNIYVFEPGDPIIRAYRALFPKLFRDAGEMPASVREHARYPETFFRVQAEMYRTFHMLNPQAFYNKEDLWDVARNIYGQESRPQAVAPTYVVATLPGESKPEFLLTLPFTPRNKDNLIGLMVARCDGPNLGELRFYQLSKQALIFGPMQIEARINQDQNISKDLSLWNQQGSQVLRGQMLTLPVGDTFVYIEPIYIQASEARMPQLKKVVVAAGNDLFYRDTYEEALAALAGESPAPALAAGETPQGTAPPQAAPTPGTLEEVRRHMRRYRELASQGKWSEAGRELEAIENLLRR
jgi:uncharacterized membrane protein (UPF0182 family)